MQLFTAAVGLAAWCWSKDLAKIAIPHRVWMYLAAAMEEAPSGAPAIAFIPGGENPHTAILHKRPARVVYAAIANLPVSVVNEIQSSARDAAFPTAALDPLEGSVVIFQLFPKLCMMKKADGGPLLEKLAWDASAKDVLRPVPPSRSQPRAGPSAFSEADKQAATTYVQEFLPQGSACEASRTRIGE